MSVVVVQSLSCVRLFVTPWPAACQASLSFTISRSLLKLTSVELVIPSSHLILCHTLFLLPSVFPSIKVFSSEWAVCVKWPKYWSFSFSISPSNEYSGLISFRMDWFGLWSPRDSQQSSAAPQFKSIRSLAISLLYDPTLTTTRKTVALTIWTFVSKVMSLLFNTISRFVIAFLPRSKRLLISWLQSPSSVILEPKKIKSVTDRKSTRLNSSHVF